MLVPYSRTLFNHYWFGQCSVYITYFFHILIICIKMQVFILTFQCAYFHKLTAPIVSWKPILPNRLEYLQYTVVLYLARDLLFSSLLIPHLSSLYPPSSPLIPHASPIIPHPMSLISNPIPLTTYPLFLISKPSSLIPKPSSLIPPQSSLIPYL